MSVLEIMNSYCDDILSGKIKACQQIKQACKRHYWDLSRIQDPDFKYMFSEERALHFMNFMKLLRDPDYPDQQIILMPWHYFVLGSMFGWVTKDINEKTQRSTRRFRKAQIFIGRKNGKSFIAAGIALYMLAFDGERQSEVYSAATKRDQAAIVFESAAAFVKSSKLQALIKQTRNKLTVKNNIISGKMEPLSSDARTLDGLRPHCAVCDEVAAMESPDVYNVLESAFGSKTQPMLFSISTAGYVLDGIATNLWGYGEYILNSIKTESYQDSYDVNFSALYTLDEEDDIFDETNWIKANPMIGILKSYDDMREQAQKAKDIPSFLGEFKTKHLNLFCNSTKTWLEQKTVDQCFKESINIPELKGTDCYIGMDLSTKKDLSALTLLFPQFDGSLKVITKAYIPEDTYNEKCSARIKHLYAEFIRRGELTLTAGATIDYEYIRADLLKLRELYNIKSIAFDPNNANMLCQRLENHDGFKMIEVPQSPKVLNEPSKEFEKMLIDGTITFEDSLFRWCCLNANIKTYPDGNIRVQKENISSENKIDPVVACLFAFVTAVIPDVKFNKYESFQGIELFGF